MGCKKLYSDYGTDLTVKHRAKTLTPKKSGKNVRSETGFKFSALELDNETGNYYATHRYYNPKWSIFLSVDPLAEEFPSWTPYHYVHQNPINMIDPTGLSADWIYDEENDEYFWDGGIDGQKAFNDSDYDQDRYSYVGSSIKDVSEHHQENHPIMSIFKNPKFGEDRTRWPGEILEYEPNVFERAKDFGVENNIPFSETIYNIADDATVFLTSFDLLNPREQPFRLDGSTSIRGSSEHIDSGISGYMTVLPLPKFNIRGFNMAQSNSFFKGTWYNQLSPKTKGTTLKTFNFLMKKLVTPKIIFKQMKSQLD